MGEKLSVWWDDSFAAFALRFLAAFVVLFALLMVLVFAGVNAASAKSCAKSAAVAGVPSDYGFWSGCFYIVDGVAVPADQYVVNVPKER
jgi:hypothetical protein